MGENGNTPEPPAEKELTRSWPATACAFTLVVVGLPRYGKKISCTLLIVGITWMYITVLAVAFVNESAVPQPDVPLTENVVLVPLKEVVPKFHFWILLVTAAAARVSPAV